MRTDVKSRQVWRYQCNDEDKCKTADRCVRRQRTCAGQRVGDGHRHEDVIGLGAHVTTQQHGAD